MTQFFLTTVAVLAVSATGFHVTPQHRHRRMALPVVSTVRAPFSTRLASAPDTVDEDISTRTFTPATVTATATTVKPTEIMTELATEVTTTDASAIATSTPPTTTTLSERVAATMDDRIYKFNKVVIDSVYDIICLIYPVTGGPRDFARFYVLETVARVPYFAYLSVMHLRETFGERGLGERMRTHYAEADNELHHLLIMEELGGNDNGIDRAVAQTMAFGYYWYVVAVYAWSQPCAYHLSELIEDHAYNTYNTYLSEHEDMLKGMPVPKVATKYYVEDNPFLFDLFCTVKDRDEQGNFSARRPELNSLYDVFVNIRNDEKEHWKTLCNLVQYGDMQGVENSLVKGTEPAPPVTTGA